MRIRAGVSTDVGRVRERNEDAYLVHEPIFAVADGMGGHRGGNVASVLALETLGSFRMPDQGAAGALVEDIKKANTRVMQRGASDRDLRGMGTTVTAVVAEDAKAHVAHVGDSRAYLLREGNLQQLTEDHTLVQRMVREGKLTPEEAGHHPQRSILTRAVGVEDGLDVDELTLDVHAGDRIVLCTDGLTSMIDDRSIEQFLKEESDPQSAADRLVLAANQAGGDDNITVIVLEFAEGDNGSAGAIGAAVVSGAHGSESAGFRGDGPSGAQVATAVVAMPRSEPKVRIGAPDDLDHRPLQPTRRPGWRRRWILGAVGCALVVLIAVIGTRLFVDRQWYVGESGGRVAIYNGIPTKLLGFSLHHVVETTDLPASRAEQLRPWQGLGNGVNAISLQEARTIVNQIRQDLTKSATGGGA